MNTIDRLIQFMNIREEGEMYHDVVSRILLHLKEVEGCTIYEMAEMTFASTTTLSRLSKKLGFSSFSDFKSRLAADVRGYSTINRSMQYTPPIDTAEMMKLYHQTIEKELCACYEAIDPGYIDKIVGDMERFKKVYLISNFSTAFSRFQQDILMSGRSAFFISDLAEGMQTVARLSADCLIISFIPAVRESVDMIDILKAARKAGASTLVVSPAILSPFEKYADYLIRFAGSGSASDAYAMNYVMNVLSMAYRSHYVD